MKKILIAGGVVLVAAVAAWLLRAWLPKLVQLAARLSKPAAVLRHADPRRHPSTESPGRESSSDLSANRVASR
jgi:hypothetical protein